MIDITINQLNAETKDLTNDEYSTVKGGWLPVAAFVVNTAFKAKQYQDQQAVPGQQVAYQEFLTEDPIVGNVNV